MRTVGEILSEARNKRNLSYEQVEKDTKIRKKIIEILESSNWSTLPPTYVKGLLKNYSNYLGLEEKRILAFFRREYDEKKSPSGIKPVSVVRAGFRLTPGNLTIVLSGLATLAVIVYLLFQYQSFTAPPKLEILEPKNNEKTSALEVNVVGRTWSDAILKINGEEVQVSPGGTFSVAVGLKEGNNILTITAANRFGNLSKITRTVVVELPKQNQGATGTSDKNVKLTLQVINKSTFVTIEGDGKVLFEGLMLSGTKKEFEAKDRIKVTTENGATTKVIINGQELILGKDGEKVEKEFTL
jgi:cytoskeletal protein RodZ